MLVLDTGLVTLRSTLLRVVVFKTGKSDDDTEKNIILAEERDSFCMNFFMNGYIVGTIF